MLVQELRDRGGPAVRVPGRSTGGFGLDPERLPVLGAVGWQLLGYHRTEYYDDASGSWR